MVHERVLIWYYMTMLRIGKLSDYAILLMVELQTTRQGLLSAQNLAERTHLELPTASKLLKLLAQANLVISSRGSNGGYTLARPASVINVAEIIAAIEGPIAMTECGVDTGLCSQESHCSMRGNWQRISSIIVGALEEVSLADMAQPSANPGIHGLRIALVNS